MAEKIKQGIPNRHPKDVCRIEIKFILLMKLAGWARQSDVNIFGAESRQFSLYRWYWRGGLWSKLLKTFPLRKSSRL